MRVLGMSKTFNREVESDVELLSRLFDLQRAKSVERVGNDVYAVRDGDSAFLLTDFHDDFALVDVVDGFKDVRMEFLKGNSIEKLMDIKRGKVVLLENSLAGSALPPMP